MPGPPTQEVNYERALVAKWDGRPGLAAVTRGWHNSRQSAVSGSEDMTLRLWDLAQGKLLFTFAASSAVTACDIARDGSVAIAAEVSGRVHTFVVGGLPAYS